MGGGVTKYSCVTCHCVVDAACTDHVGSDIECSLWSCRACWVVLRLNLRAALFVWGYGGRWWTFVTYVVTQSVTCVCMVNVPQMGFVPVVCSTSCCMWD